MPISFKEFFYQVKDEIGTFNNDILYAYILSGGSPLAAESLYRTEKLDDTFVSIIVDWILGDLASAGRSRIFLLNILRKLYQSSPSPMSYTKLAKEAGLANNTAALDYIERLADLLCIYPMMQWDSSKDIVLARKASKLPFINLAVAWSFHPKAPRYIHEIRNLEGAEKGAMYEWLVAQELWRRGQLDLQKNRSKSIKHLYEVELKYWASSEHEIDFVTAENDFFEVKAGQATALEFSWFRKVFPKKKLTVISESNFSTETVEGIDFEKFLLSAPSDLYYDEDKAPWLKA